MNNTILQNLQKKRIEVEKLLDKVKTILKILDFSDEQIIKQIKELGEIMLMSVWLWLGEIKNVQPAETLKQEFSQENLEKFLNENYSKEEIQQIVKQVSKKLWPIILKKF
jgi:predicted adenine nucleotide alpha hydrolase (AANH) superfamily ATPase